MNLHQSPFYWLWQMGKLGAMANITLLIGTLLLYSETLFYIVYGILNYPTWFITHLLCPTPIEWNILLLIKTGILTIMCFFTGFAYGVVITLIIKGIKYLLWRHAIQRGEDNDR